jgi:hypothetical protein
VLRTSTETLLWIDFVLIIIGDEHLDRASLVANLVTQILEAITGVETLLLVRVEVQLW